MKKIFVAAALLAAFGLTAAPVSTATTANAQISVTTEDAFKAIELDALPQAIKDAVAGKYEGMTVKAAAVKEEEGVKTYKLTLADAEGKAIEVLFNENGEVLSAQE